MKSKNIGCGLLTLLLFIGFIAMMAAGQDSDGKPNTDKKINTESKNITATQENPKKTNKIKLSLNNFNDFTERYKTLSNKTEVWDKELYKKKVTWSGFYIEGSDNRLLLYGGKDYDGSDWSTLSSNKSNHKAYKVFAAELNKPTNKKFENGEKITVTGNLESRGDYDLNYHWKLYDAEIK